MDDEKTFSLRLSHEQAWMIQSMIKPNAAPKGLPSELQVYRRLVVPFREQVNDALLRFADEADLETVTIDCEIQHAWLLDAVFSYDGNGGSATDLLIQCFRGMWALGYHLPLDLVAEPSYPIDLDENPDTSDFAQT
jgi:hypothetical protein